MHIQTKKMKRIKTTAAERFHLILFLLSNTTVALKQKETSPYTINEKF